MEISNAFIEYNELVCDPYPIVSTHGIKKHAQIRNANLVRSFCLVSFAYIFSLNECYLAHGLRKVFEVNGN